MKRSPISKAFLHFTIFILVFFTIHFNSFSQPFPCDNGSRLYFFQEPSSPNGSDYLSYITNYTATPVVTPMFAMPSTQHNALAANPIDHYLYYLQGTNLMRLNALGGSTFVCNLGFQSPYGCFDYLGRFWTLNGNNLVAYNINSCALVKGPFTISAIGFKDIVFNPNDCHLYVGNSKIDTNGIIVSTSLANFPGSDTYGGAAVGSNGLIYGIAANSTSNIGTLAELNLLTNTSSVLVNFTPGPTTGQSDMASFACAFVTSHFTTNQLETNCSLINFKDQSTGPVSAWYWDFGDTASGLTNTSNLQNPTHLFSSAGTYSVKLIVSLGPNVCYPQTQDTYITTLTISPIPQVSASNGTLACNPLATTTLIANSTSIGPIDYNWLGTGIINGAATPTATIDKPGTYTVMASYPITGCSSIAIITVTQTPLLNLHITSSNCFGTINYTATAITSNGSGTYSYVWNNNQTSPTLSTLSTGNYSLTVFDNNTNCVQYGSVNIMPLPQVMISINTLNDSVCVGENFSLTAVTNNAIPPLTYTWSTNDITNSITSILQSNKTFTVSVTDSNGCSATNSLLINALALPAVTFSATQIIGCAPLCVTFESNIVGAEYYWDFGNGNNSTQATPTECYKSAGNHSVKLDLTDNYGCTNTIIKNDYIYVYPLTIAGFNETLPTNNLEYMVEFTNTSSGSNSYQWNFGISNDVSFVNSENPSYTYNDPGTYTVTLITSNQYDCTDTIRKKITLIENFTLFSPNAFTPNQNELNDVWNPKGAGIDSAKYELSIFNRWGVELFKTNTWGNGWDGSFHGKFCENGIYIYKITIEPLNKSISYPSEYTGYISLIR